MEIDCVGVCMCRGVGGGVYVCVYAYVCVRVCARAHDPLYLRSLAVEIYRYQFVKQESASSQHKIIKIKICEEYGRGVG